MAEDVCYCNASYLPHRHTADGLVDEPPGKPTLVTKPSPEGKDDQSKERGRGRAG